MQFNSIKEGIMKTVFSTILLIAILCGLSTAQPNPDTLWTRTYGGISDDKASSIQQTSDGGYIIAGYTESFGSGGRDFFLVKIDSDGDTMWTRTYGGTGSDFAYSVQQTLDGGYIVAGGTSSFGAGDMDYYLVKTNSIGDTVWTRTYGGTGMDDFCEVQQTTDGGYIIEGCTNSFGAGSVDFYLVKTNPLGDTLWTKTYGRSTQDWGSSVDQTSDGGYILAGYTSFGAGSYDIYLVKTNSVGDTLWTRNIGGAGEDDANSIEQTTDGGYIVAGLTDSFGAGLGDFYLVKTDSLGSPMWTRTFGGSSSDWAWSVRQTSDEGYIIAGWTDSFGAGDGDFYIVRTNSVGDSLWTRTFGGIGNEWASSAQYTSDCGYIIAGYTSSFGAGGYDFYIVRTGPELPSGYVSLISWGPPDWGYRLHHVSGCLSSLVFTNFCVGTSGWVSGDASASWSMLPNGDGNNGDSILFMASTPLTSGTIDTFGLSHPTCSDFINWQAGDSTGIINGPLPVELTIFLAIPGDKLIRLHWETQSETDNDHFVLYKKVLGEPDFTPIAQIPGQGTTTQPHEYNYTDYAVINGITYQYRISDVDINGIETLHDITASATPQSSSNIPVEHTLYQNYPNPFNPTTTIRYDVKTEGLVRLQIFNLMGREVSTLVNELVSAGSHTITWDASELPSGIYLYRMDAGDFHQIKKLLLLK